MDVTPTSQTTSTQSTQTGSANSNALLTSDFEVFLQMLTAQARYQDPLDPIDSSEYAAQLAQFSMVEQQVATNSLLENLISALNVSEAGSLASWIGMDALTTGPARYSGQPLTIVPESPSGAEEMFLVVNDAAGTQIERQRVAVSSDPITWTGLQSNGSAYPAGNYTFQIETRANGEVLKTEPARVFGRVTESRFENGEMRVVLASGHSAAADEVLGLRAPQ